MSDATTKRFELKQLFHLMFPILITHRSASLVLLIPSWYHLSAADLAAIAVGVGLWIPIMLLFAGIMITTTPFSLTLKRAVQEHQRKFRLLHVNPL